MRFNSQEFKTAGDALLRLSSRMKRIQDAYARAYAARAVADAETDNRRDDAVERTSAIQKLYDQAFLASVAELDEEFKK